MARCVIMRWGCNEFGVVLCGRHDLLGTAQSNVEASWRAWDTALEGRRSG